MHKTGATRYQKFLKAEKAKTKLKGKKDKELPKGTNVTKTNFNVKKIVIKEQLKKHDWTEAVTTRKLNSQELLSRLNHFNTNTRVDALNGLMEIITSYPTMLLQSLGPLINGISALTLNVEKIVRQTALKVLHLILSNVTQEKIEPFFDILSTYLRNAMTHIDSRIQEDSLLLLDILLLCNPIKIAEDFQKIIPSFLDMISKLRMDQPGRILTVNLNTQMTSLNWRIKVFQRLKELMQNYAEYSKIFEDKTSTTVIPQMFNSSKNLNYYPLFNPYNISNSQVTCFLSKNSDVALEADDIQRFSEFTDILLPMLFETWLEACPNKKSNTTLEMVVSEESSILLKYILEIFSLVHSFYKHFHNRSPSLNIENTFRQKYKLLFSQQIVSLFPFVTVVRSRETKQIDGKNNMTIDPKLVLVNLEICDLFIKFNPNVNRKIQSKEIHNVLSYIEKTFTQMNDNIHDKIVKILYNLFSIESVGWCKTLAILDSLMRKIIWVYFNKNISNSFKQKIFTLLWKIALNEKLSHFHTSDAFEMWLKHLPDILLCESIHPDTVYIIHRFAVTNNKVFNAILKPKLLDIIKNLPNITITNSINDSSCYHRLFSLFYWLKVWDNDCLNLLERQLMENVYKSDYSKYIFDTLRLKSGAI